MAPVELKISHKVLLVDDDESMRNVMTETLGRKGFTVVAAANVADALKLITSENFDALITDLHMPNPGDGFTVVSAMRHAQPGALILLVSGYPDVQSAMAAILLEPDEILVKPFETGRLADILRDKIVNRKPAARLEKERVGVILQRSVGQIIDDWLARVKRSSELNHLVLCDEERTGHLPKLVEDLVVRLTNPFVSTTEDVFSEAAVAHGRLRYKQGYTAEMLVYESRILQVTLFGTLHNNLNCLDFSLLLPDVMTIADEVDAQLTQTMGSFMRALQKAWAA
jgi:DNA-binding response OmpR family regulator